MSLINRQIAITVKSLITKYPILAITGPRQSGKTTLLKNLLPNYIYVSLEDKNERDFAVTDPKGFLKQYSSKVIFDEVQKAPELFSYLQTEVDRSGEMGQFILSGSQNFLLLEQITQSLAGRVALFKLLPFDITELKEAELLPVDWKELVLKGGYPAIYDKKLDHAVFHNNYLQTYVQRDVTELLKVQDMKRFNDFLELCAGHAGQLLNLSKLAAGCGISQPTAKSWLSILESSYIIFLLNPYHNNFRKRIIKAPKLYFYDTGLLSFLSGLRTIDDLDNPTQLGHLFENLTIAEIFKKNFHQYQLKKYWFWRDSNGNEVDLLSKQGMNFHIFEIKSTKTILYRLLKGLNYFDEISDGMTKSKTIIYGGENTHERTDFNVLSWKDL